MALIKPITALRLLNAAIAILLIGALFLPKANNFLVGVALGLNVGVLVTLWNRQLQWQDGCDRGETIEMKLGEPQR